MKTLLKIFFTICILQFAVCISAFSQNLVPNPSFEEYYFCPEADGETGYAVGWNTNINSADYFNACCQDPLQVSVPQNAWGYQFPPDTSCNAYAGFFAYGEISPNSVEFIGRQLSSPLIIGQKYFVSFKVSLTYDGNFTNCGVDKLGILFTNVFYGDTFIVSSPPPVLNNFDHVHINMVIVDTANWTTVSGSFIADSSYQYFLIGHFFDTANTNYICFNSNSKVAYYYLDDICVSTDSLVCNEYIFHCNSNSSKNNIVNDSIKIYPNPVKNKLFIENINSKEFIYIIYNSFGEEIKYGSTSHSNIEIDLSNFSPDIYFIQCFINNNSLTKKFILIN